MIQSRPPGTPLRLGTRRSLLAQAQSSWVARQLEAVHPGLRVELVGVETRGDQLLDVPLSTAPGREFFVAELDTALIAGHVDFTVHSFKDLSLQRPPELVLAAVPERANPRDIILFGPSTASRLEQHLPLRVGTGAPRRITNIADFLPTALPGITPQPAPEFIPIRGNIDTRLSRIHLPVGEERHLDAVVLALAGLSRLWTSSHGKERLEALLSGIRWMVLPLGECPTAPAQGALAIECRANDAAMRAYLAALHHPATARHVDSERQELAEWGGGCHQALGATAVSVLHAGSVLYVRGRKPDGTFISRTQTTFHEKPTPLAPSPMAAPSPATEPRRGSQKPALYVTADTRPQDFNHSVKDHVWASDVGVWRAWAQRGVWVEGCAEGHGLLSLESTFAEPVLGLVAPEETPVTLSSSAGTPLRVATP